MSAPSLTRVVIAEDEAIIRLDLKEILLDEGYDVVGETGRGDEAVELVADAQARPGDPRRQDARAGRPRRPPARSPRLKVAVLMLTAFSQRNLIDEARDAGVAAYLVKPFQRSELIPAIDQAAGPVRAGVGHRRPRSRPSTRAVATAPRTRSRPGGWSTGPRGS